MNGALLRYRLLLALLAPVILLFNAWQALRAGDRRLFKQRLGLGLRRRRDHPLWLHAASVGELIAAQVLLVALREKFPELPIVVTTTTATGACLARTRLPADIQHIYLPLDWPSAVKRFLRSIQPRAALIMETELWPNLFITITRQDIPLLIVNGRLSSRSMNAGPWVKQLLRISLQGVNAVLARSKQDAENYIALGAAAERVQTVGNIKFASSHVESPVAAMDLGRPFVLAASTREENEELQIASLWQQQNFAEKFSRLLVIAPRHPNRCGTILKQLQDLHTRIAVRSRGDVVTADTQIYLADTLGELESFMAAADIVFMGGSLVPRGGQNILEAARLGKPLLFGPYMDNFSDEAALLLQANGAQQVADSEQLGQCLQNWLEDPQKAQAYGQRAQAMMAQQDDVLGRYLQAVSEFCGLETASKD